MSSDQVENLTPEERAALIELFKQENDDEYYKCYEQSIAYTHSPEEAKKMVEEMKRNFLDIDYFRKTFPDKFKILLDRIRNKYTIEEQIIIKIEHEYDESILSMLDKRFMLISQNKNRMSAEEYHYELSKIIMMNRKVHNDEMNPLKVNVPKEYFHSQPIPQEIVNYFEKNQDLVKGFNLLEIYNFINIISERPDIPTDYIINALIHFNIVNKDVDRNKLSELIRQLMFKIVIKKYSK